MCLWEDGDRPEFFDQKRVCGRKPHRCIECNRTIAVGATHLAATGKWDGRVITHRTCNHCQMLARWVSDICGGIAYGEVGFEVQEHLRDGIGGIDVARAFAQWRMKWRSRRTGELLPIPHRLIVPEEMRPKRLSSGETFRRTWERAS